MIKQSLIVPSQDATYNVKAIAAIVCLVGLVMRGVNYSAASEKLPEAIEPMSNRPTLVF